MQGDGRQLVPVRRVSILAGGGRLPGDIAVSALRQGATVHVVALKGEADGDFGALPVAWVNWGQVGRILAVLKAARTDELVIVGRVRRPDILKVRPDLGFFTNLPALLKILTSGGDDSVLRRVVRFFERHGIRVVGPADVAPELVVGEGPVGSLRPEAGAAADIAIGFEVVRALGRFDIGQGVVVSEGAIHAIEGAEGTDAMIARVATARRAGGGEISGGRGVLAKRTKPGQDIRVDMPAIGPDTVDRAAEAGLAGVAVEAGRVLALDRTELARRADATGLFVAGCPDGAAVTDRDTAVPRDGGTVVSFGKSRLTKAHAIDVARGAGVVSVLARFGAGRAAVVTRKYVLAVEAKEGVAATLARAGELRQWGRLAEKQRQGFAVLRDPEDATDDVVSRAAAIGLAGLAVPAARVSGDRLTALVEATERAGLVLAGYSGGGAGS